MSDTLADHLRTLPDEDLITLFRLRPDLVVPPPGHMDALAGRVRSRLSVARALDQLDRFHLEVLDAVRLAREADGTSALERVLALTSTAPGGPPAAQVRAAVRRLADLLLIHGPDDALRVVSTVDDVVGPYPAGLGRPARELSPEVAAVVGDPAGLRRAIMAAPPEARALLDRLATDGPVATVADADPDGLDGDPDEGRRPVTAPRAVVSWLVGRGLVAEISRSTVELPREVGILLRRDTGPLGPLHPTPPVPVGQARDPAQVDAAGAGAAMEAVRQADAVLTALADEPAPTLRGGGLGIRELRRLAKVTGIPEPAVALVLETAYAAGLIGEDTRTGPSDDGTLLPTTGFDNWRLASLAERWHRLAAAWLVMRRQPGLVGRRDARGRLVGPLTAGADRARAPEVRRTTLAALAALAPGTAVGLDELLALLRWHAPGRVAGQRQAMAEVLTEAEWLGITGQGALTSYGHALVTGGRDDERDAAPPAVEILDRLLPEPVSELVVQADLSVVVPGPPEPDLAAELELVTERESVGGASVHRVTRDSVRRALDAGYTAADLHAMFTRRSRTPVPQTLTYLIDDVARTHGGLRVGSAAGYLRSEDESLVTQVLADRRLAGLELRRLAPTVLVSPHPVARLLAALREAGYAPVPEDAYGAVVLAPPRGRRAPVRARPVAAPRFAAATASEPRLRKIIEDMRRGDAAARIQRRVRPATSGPAAAQAHAEALAVLREALKDRAAVWVGYLDAHGSTTSRLLRPVSIGAGYLRAESVDADTLHTVALHRITGATRET